MAWIPSSTRSFWFRRCATCCLVRELRATTANIGYYGGILFALFLVGWGMALLVGAGRRPVWTRPHLDAHHHLFFTFYFVERLFHEHLDARRASASCRNRHRRRMGDRRDADLGRVAGRAANHGRGDDAHGLLLRIFSGRPGQLFCRQPVRLEMDVRRGRRAGAARDPDSQRDDRACALGSEARTAWPEIDNATYVFGNILAAISPPHAPQSDVPACLHDWFVGGLCVRAGGDHVSWPRGQDTRHFKRRASRPTARRSFPSERSWARSACPALPTGWDAESTRRFFIR